MRKLSKSLTQTTAAAGLAAGLVLGLSACVAPAGSASASGTSAAASSSSAAGPAEEDPLVAQLAALDGVTDAKKLDGDFQYYTAKYLVTFEQPLDWQDPSAGSFPQRVTVGVVASPVATVMSASDTALAEESLGTDDADELARTIQANYVSVERRLADGSRPASLGTDEAALSPYLTDANTAADLHKVYQELSRVLPGVWAASGSGAAGSHCLAYAQQHSQDMRFYAALASSGDDGSGSSSYQWLDAAECDLLLLCSPGDPLASEDAPGAANPRVHVFVASQDDQAGQGASQPSIAALSDADRSALMTLLSEWLGVGAGGKETHA